MIKRRGKNAIFPAEVLIKDGRFFVVKFCCISETERKRPAEVLLK